MDSFVGWMFRMTGMFRLFKLAVTRRKVSIVMYHNPDPELFEDHIRFLSRHYSFISMSTLVTAIREKDWSKIPDHSIVVTFDDGHKGNYKLLSIIREYDVKPTIYCCSDIIDTKRHFWWSEASPRDLRVLKRYDNEERLRILGEDSGFHIEKEYNRRHALTKRELMEMKDVVDIGSHTRFHPVLSGCNTVERENEISLSKIKIENDIGTECSHFSYPHGDYDDEIIEMVKAAGYESARTTDVGWNGRRSDPYRLRITVYKDNMSINSLVGQLTGINLFLEYLFKGGFNGRRKKVRALEKAECDTEARERVGVGGQLRDRSKKDNTW